LKDLAEAIGHLEAIAAEHYADREMRAIRRAATTRLLVTHGKATIASRFVLLPPPDLNPDITLWLQ
jgi:hypothetical protein